MAQVGRISGPLLTANLERNGNDIWFRNTNDETQLLYLDVNTGLIGINKDAPGVQLDIAGRTKNTNLIVNTSADIADFNLSSSDINNLTGDINLNASNSIVISTLQTDNIEINDNSVKSFKSNANIELLPNGSGTVELTSSLNVDGSLHSTGDIIFEGNIIFGDDINNDTVNLNAAIDSNLVPSDDGIFALGEVLNRWSNLDTNLLTADSILAGNIELATGENLNLRQGNIIYVAENGDDNNVGDHPNGPFKTIKRALDFADASTDGPVSIYIYPGGYEEELPLVVPTNTSVIGADYRNTFVRPSSADQSKDIFHLNGESTVQNLTITDFYYDSGNDTGYAFRFAPNTVVTTRSPYVQNVTVITKGTTTSASDPRGFNSGDAGKGALVDGADVLSASQEASMLFHSVTFITPGVDALTMTNGVRVEWLNSFTYFANRGLYAVDGATGHLSTDGSTVKYGAELRSIGSASVYGNYGAVADGADCLMYLIQHNVGYIGAGRFVDNDPSRAIQSQEIVELNSGNIYYQTTNHLGTYRVGNNFEINQETGETNLVLTEADIDSFNGLTVTTNGSITFVDGTKIETGNLRFRNNTISSTSGDIDLASAAGTINLQSSTNMQKDLSISGNLSFDGSLITVGDDSTDTVQFITEFTQNLLPDVDLAYKLGTSSKTWQKAWLSQANFDDIKVQDNFITTTVSNADLELRANSTGLINIDSNNVNITNNLTVDGTTDLLATSITGTRTYTGDVTLENPLGPITDSATMNGTNGVRGSNNFYVEFRGGSPIVVDDYFQENTYGRYVYIGNDLSAAVGNYVMFTFDNGHRIIIKLGTPYSPGPGYPTNMIPYAVEEVVFFQGESYQPPGPVDPIDVIYYQGKTAQVLVSSSLGNGAEFDVSNLTITQDLDVNSQAQFEEILFDGNVIQTTTTNSNLDLRANGTGTILVPLTDVIIAQNVSVQDITGTDLSITESSTSVELIASDNLTIRDNFITTTQSNSDLELIANGTGNIFTESLVVIEQDLSVSNNLSFTGNLTGDDILGAVNINASNTYTMEVLQTDNQIRISDNNIGTTVSNSNLELRANSAGGVSLEGIMFEGNILSTGTEDSTSVDIDFTSTANGNLNTVATGALKTPVGESIERINNLGDIRFNTDTNLFEGYATSHIGFGGIFSDDRLTSVFADQTSNTINMIVGGDNDPIDSTTLAGQANEQGLVLNGLQVEDILIDNNTIATNVSNADLELSAGGTGEFVIDNISLKDSAIKNNTLSEGIMTIGSTRYGKVKFDNTYGIVVPFGSIAERPSDPPVGDTRWNTDSVVLETYDGDTYIAAAGIAAAISQEEFDDLLLEYTLALG